MASTNKTVTLQLSQFTTADRPSWLTDYNDDMEKIDTFAASVDGDVSQAVSDATNAKTIAQTANTTAQQAQTAAQLAQTAAQQAQTAAQQAQNTATSAQSTATSANQAVSAFGVWTTNSKTSAPQGTSGINGYSVTIKSNEKLGLLDIEVDITGTAINIPANTVLCSLPAWCAGKTRTIYTSLRCFFSAVEYALFNMQISGGNLITPNQITYTTSITTVHAENMVHLD